MGISSFGLVQATQCSLKRIGHQIFCKPEGVPSDSSRSLDKKVRLSSRETSRISREAKSFWHIEKSLRQIETNVDW